jgi:hypothetical protein
MTLARRAFVLVLSVLVLTPSAPAQILARGKLTGADDVRAYADALKQLKARTLTLSWKDLALEDAVKELRVHLARTILFAPAAYDLKKNPISFELDRIPAGSALRVIESAAKVRFLFEGGIVWVTTPEDAVKRSLVMRVYDVSDLLYQAPDFPAPILSLHPGKPVQQPQEESASKRDTGEIIDLVRTLAGQEKWDVEGTSIAISGHLLVVTQTPEVHARIREYVAALAALL